MEFTPDGTKEEVIKALTGWRAESQGTREGVVPATDWQWPTCFHTSESKGKRNSVPRAFCMWGIQRTHSYRDKTQPEGQSYFRSLRAQSPSCPFPFGCLYYHWRIPT